MRVWSIDEAAGSLEWASGMLARLRALLADATVDAAQRTDRSSTNGHSKPPSFGTAFQALLNEMQDAGISIRDPQRGLVDFHATAPSGRAYLLCWVEGEPELAWWHWPEDGFAGRTPLSDPPQ